VRLIHHRLFWLALLLLAAASAAAEPFGHGLLWKIERPGGRPSYLYGTMHSEDPRVITLPAAVRDAFARSASLTLEVTLDEPTLHAMATAMFFSDGRDLRQVAGPELFNAALRAMAQHGMPAEAVLRMKPWAVMTILSTPPQETGMFLDRLLYGEARRTGKPVYGLETGAEQMALFDDTPLPDQLHLLRETLHDYAEMPVFFEEMITLYQARDAGGLLALSRRELPPDDPIAQRFMRRLLEDRNRRMAARMQQRLRQGNAFIAIGALHLPGADGVLQLLQRRGYRVSVVY